MKKCNIKNNQMKIQRIFKFLIDSGYFTVGFQISIDLIFRKKLVRFNKILNDNVKKKMFAESDLIFR